MGLTPVAPILGHATRHLYRKVIVRDSAQGQRPRGAVLDRNRRRRGQRSIARMIEANIFAAEVLKQLVNWQRRSAGIAGLASMVGIPIGTVIAAGHGAFKPWGT
jgi:hypothetical protein